jgi:SAM-dependent methyltransferase
MVLLGEQTGFFATWCFEVSTTAMHERPLALGAKNEADSGRYGFPAKLLELVLCPRDSGRLKLSAIGPTAFVRQGWAHCDRCKAHYEIRAGILRLLPGQEDIEVLVKTEQGARDASAEQYDARFRPWENAIEMSAIQAAESFTRCTTMVDLACGTGRLTIQLAALAGATLAVDFSEKSLQILATKLEPGANVGLVWSDAIQLRLAPDSVDVAIATQLLEHIPDKAQRLRLFSNVHGALRDGSEFVLTAYYYSALRALLRRKKEGLHSNGIFYHRFTSSEIRNELGDLFDVLCTRPVQIDPRLLPHSNRATTYFARGLEKMRMPFWIGQLLLVKARKRKSFGRLPAQA